MWNRLLVSALQRAVRHGSLNLTLPDGTGHRFGTGAPEVSVRLLDARLPARILRNPDIAVGEAYMDGTLTVDGDDLRGFLTLLVQNHEVGRLPLAMSAPFRLRRLLRHWQTWNPLHVAQRNVAHHYDLSGEIYDLFLDENKQYTCAYFRADDVTLEQAQADKMAHIGRKLLIRPGMRVLDIGSGFGTLAITLARDWGARVVGVTLSQVQLAEAQARAKAAGVADRVEFRLTDYRDVREPFDRIVSVGMMEHVGLPQLGTYFRNVAQNLTEDGVALIHYIGRSSPPDVISPWFQKYIFPGAYCPALSEATAAVEKSGLILADVEVWRGHYERTLAHWLARFEANADRARALYDDRFVRMWRYYLLAAERGFADGQLVIHQLHLGKSRAAVPRTRDYLYHAANA